MTKEIFIAFSIETKMDAEGISTHFNPAEITESLKVLPIQTQSYDKEQKEFLRSRKPSNSWCSSWIYRIEGDGNLESNQDTYLESLMEYCVEQFLAPKKNSILKIVNKYDALCTLEIYIFNAKDFITNIFIEPRFMKVFTDINCPINIYTHSKPIIFYPQYKYKKMFQFPNVNDLNNN